MLTLRDHRHTGSAAASRISPVLSSSNQRESLEDAKKYHWISRPAVLDEASGQWAQGAFHTHGVELLHLIRGCAA
jgi:hypothetical protein